LETRFWRVWTISQKVRKLFDGYWTWLLSKEKLTYEIENHGFHHAKVNDTLLGDHTEHVLCLYYTDDSRKDELAERNKQEYGVKYRYWKSDSDTLKGKYSKEFLDKLPEDERKHFTTQKKLIEFKDGKGKLILRQKSKEKQD